MEKVKARSDKRHKAMNSMKPFTRKKDQEKGQVDTIFTPLVQHPVFVRRIPYLLFEHPGEV